MMEWIRGRCCVAADYSSQIAGWYGTIKSTLAGALLTCLTCGLIISICPKLWSKHAAVIFKVVLCIGCAKIGEIQVCNFLNVKEAAVCPKDGALYSIEKEIVAKYAHFKRIEEDVLKRSWPNSLGLRDSDKCIFLCFPTFLKTNFLNGSLITLQSCKTKQPLVFDQSTMLFVQNWRLNSDNWDWIIHMNCYEILHVWADHPNFLIFWSKQGVVSKFVFCTG